MAGMSKMDKGEPHFPEARRKMAPTYDSLATCRAMFSHTLIGSSVDCATNLLLR